MQTEILKAASDAIKADIKEKFNQAGAVKLAEAPGSIAFGSTKSSMPVIGIAKDIPKQ